MLRPYSGLKSKPRKKLAWSTQQAELWFYGQKVELFRITAMTTSNLTPWLIVKHTQAYIRVFLFGCCSEQIKLLRIVLFPSISVAHPRLTRHSLRHWTRQVPQGQGQGRLKRSLSIAYLFHSAYWLFVDVTSLSSQQHLFFADPQSAAYEQCYRTTFTISLDTLLPRDVVTIDGFWIHNRNYWALWYCARLQFKVTRTHTHECPQSRLYCRWLVAAFNEGHSPSSGFPNGPRPELPTSHTHSS
jgi:hypothetical protein